MYPNFFSRYSTWACHLTFAVLAVLAIWFFKERTIILDVALQSFQLLHQDKLAIQVNRFGAAMTQVFPFLALKLKLSLKAVLILYSLSFVLVHWIMFTICDSWLKVKGIAFAILLFTIFMVNHTFFWAQNEIIQSTSLCLVFWALLIRNGVWRNLRWWHPFIGLFLLITLAFFHPLTIFPFAFAGVYFLLDNIRKKPAIQSSLIWVVLVVFFAIVAVKYVAFPNWYDTQTTGRLSMQNIQIFFSDILAAAGFQTFMKHLPVDFYLLPLALTALTFFYVQKRLFLKLSYVWTSLLIYILMVMIAYIEGGHWFHVESQYLPVSIFVILPLAWEVIPAYSSTKRGAKATVAVLALACIIRIADIFHTSNFYSGRVNFIASSLQKTWKLEGKKFIIEEALVDKTYLMQTWSFGYETLYYSALQSPDSTRSIMILPSMPEEAWRLSEPKKFMAYGNVVPYEELPKHLFHFTDTIHNYRQIRAEDWEIENGEWRIENGELRMEN